MDEDVPYLDTIFDAPLLRWLQECLAPGADASLFAGLWHPGFNARCTCFGAGRLSGPGHNESGDALAVEERGQGYFHALHFVDMTFRQPYVV